MAKKDLEMFGSFGHRKLDDIAKKIAEWTGRRFKLEDDYPDSDAVYTFEGAEGRSYIRNKDGQDYVEMTVVFRVNL